MKRAERHRCTCQFVVCVLIAAALLCPVQAPGARVEEILSYDDGTAEDYVLYSTYGMIVCFQAPPWARSVISAQVYIGDPGGASRSAEFEVSVHGVQDGNPVQPGPAVASASSGTAYPGYSWVSSAFEPAVSLDDHEVFPDNKFYAKVNWLEFAAPAVGWDTHDPAASATLGYDAGTWVPLLGVNLMVRAVVSDVPTPVEATSWTRMKALFAQAP